MYPYNGTRTRNNNNSTKRTSSRLRGANTNELSNDSSTITSMTSSTKKSRRSCNTSKNTSIYCHGCTKNFTSYQNTKDFVTFHALKSSQCKSALYPCGNCDNRYFYNVADRNRHFGYSKQCQSYFLDQQKIANFASSIVEISANDNKEYNTTTSSTINNKNHHNKKQQSIIPSNRLCSSDYFSNVANSNTIEQIQKNMKKIERYFNQNQEKN